MKYLLLALVAVTFVGHASAYCMRWNVIDCVKNNTDCRSAARCQMETSWCGRSESCYNRTSACTRTVYMLNRCAVRYDCPRAFEFKQVVEDKCRGYFEYPSAGASVIASSVAVVVCSLAYFSMKM